MNQKRKRTLHRLRRSMEAFLVLAISNGSDKSPSSRSVERRVAGPASISLSATCRTGEAPLRKLLIVPEKTVAGEMAPSLHSSPKPHTDQDFSNEINKIKSLPNSISISVHKLHTTIFGKRN